MLSTRTTLLSIFCFALLLPPPSNGEAQPRPGTVQPRRPPASSPGRAPTSDAVRRAVQQRAGQEDQDEEQDNDARTTERRQAVQRGNVPMRLDFDRAEIAEVIRTISDLTGRNFILPDNIRGRITILSPTPVSANEAYAAFLAALEANSLAVYQVGRFHKIVPKKDAIRANIPTILDPNETWTLNEQMVTKVFRLEHIDPDQISNIANSFISRDGEIQTFPPDTLIITDVGLNLHRLERLIRQLDKSSSGADEIRIIQIRYASASDIAQKIMEVFEQTGSSSRPTQQTARTPAQRRAQARRAAQQASAAEQQQDVEISRVIADERTNKIILIADERSFSRIEDLISHLDIPTEGEGQVHVHYLMNANAQELASTLSTLTSGGTGAGRTPPRPRQSSSPSDSGGMTELFEGELKISADAGTNSLVIVSSYNDYRALSRVIEQLDIARRQVFVEAVIMEVAADSSRELGLVFHGGVPASIQGENIPIVFGNRLANRDSFSLGSLMSLGGFLAGIQGPPLEGTGGLFPSFGAILQALQTESNVNILSTPHILTSDNEEAEISVGTNVPFRAGYTPPSVGNLLGGASSGDSSADSLLRSFGGLGGIGGSLYAPIQRQNVELRLRIRPQINESDHVRLEIDEQIEELGPDDPELGPSTSRRTIKTTVVARDGQTIVLGGLMQKRNRESVSKVPVLGDVPVIGRLFRRTSVDDEKTNLLLFLTPYIIQDESDFTRILNKKLKEREEFISQFYGTDPAKDITIDFQRKVGPLGDIQRTLEEERLSPDNDGPGRGVQVIRSVWGDQDKDSQEMKEENPDDSLEDSDNELYESELYDESNYPDSEE